MRPINFRGGRHQKLQLNLQHQSLQTRLKRITSKKNLIPLPPTPAHRKYPNSYQLQKSKQVQQGNARLIRKLSQIDHRRSQHNKQHEYLQKLATIQLRSKRRERMRKEKGIQEENDMIVERIVHKLSKERSLSDFMDLSKSGSDRRIKRKKNYSTFLPQIDLVN